MDKLLNSFSGVINNFKAIGVADIFDILIVAVIIYEILAFVSKTRAGQLTRGVLLLLVFYLIANLAMLRTVVWIMDSVLQLGFMAMIVMFQPELRRALERLGQTDIGWFSSIFRFQRNDPGMSAKWKKAAVAICDAAEQLSDSKTGALIVLERAVNLSEIIRTGTTMNADVNCETLGTIFYEGTPLHDGAVVVREGMLKAAGCLLPLSNNLEIGKDMGTRHRAALGVSENSDAIAVVVSEETGIISVAKSGVLIRRLDRQSLYNMFEEEILVEKKENNTTKRGLMGRRKVDAEK